MDTEASSLSGAARDPLEQKGRPSQSPSGHLAPKFEFEFASLGLANWTVLLALSALSAIPLGEQLAPFCACASRINPRGKKVTSQSPAHQSNRLIATAPPPPPTASCGALGCAFGAGAKLQPSWSQLAAPPVGQSFAWAGGGFYYYYCYV